MAVSPPLMDPEEGPRRARAERSNLGGPGGNHAHPLVDLRGLLRRALRAGHHARGGPHGVPRHLAPRHLWLAGGRVRRESRLAAEGGRRRPSRWLRPLRDRRHDRALHLAAHVARPRTYGRQAASSAGSSRAKRPLARTVPEPRAAIASTCSWSTKPTARTRAVAGAAARPPRTSSAPGRRRSTITSFASRAAVWRAAASAARSTSRPRRAAASRILETKTRSRTR